MSRPDWWLDPPDEPTHSECSKCGSMHDNDDLHQIDKSDTWLCDDCYEEHAAKCVSCGKEHLKADMTPSLDKWVCEKCMDDYFPEFK